MKEPKPKKCKVCGIKFTPWRTTQVVCSTKCATIHTQKAKEKKIAKDTREQKERLKSRQDWLKEAQAAFNRYIRARDAGRPCISCGRHHQGQIHAGHFRTVAAASAIRFNTYNVFAQCAPCNNHLSGNLLMYRESLVKKLGVERVEWLMAQTQPRSYDIEYLKRLKRIFNKRARHVEKLHKHCIK